MEKVIRWGIAGPGNIANKFARAVKNVEGAQLVAVASQTPGKGAAFAEKYDIPKVFTSYEDMAGSDLVDAVYVATPHPFHKPCAEIFLDAKKHVLCEKPVCVNAEQAQALAECAKRNGVFLMEAMWTRFLPAVNQAVKTAKSGEIGKIRSVQADFCYSIQPDEDSKVFRNDMAGGSLLDVGIYGLNLAAMVLGDKVQEITSSADIDYGVDCHTNILMKFNDGMIASVSSALNVQKPEVGYIYGTKGYIRLPAFYGAQRFFVCAGGEEKCVSLPGMGDGFEEEICEACRCIREGKTQSDIMPMAESIRILRLMDTVRRQIGLKYPMD